MSWFTHIYIFLGADFYTVLFVSYIYIALKAVFIITSPTQVLPSWS